MTHSEQRIAIVGGGAAASAALAELRRLDFAGSVTVVAEESTPPYNRTTVNKGLLRGDVQLEGVLLPPVAPERTRWILGRRAEALDTAARTVMVAGRETLPFDGLIMATGGAPPPLPEGWRPHVHQITTAAQAAELRAELGTGPRKVAVLGGGLIGTETAGVLVAAGHQVALVDSRGLPLAHHLGDAGARWVHEQHAAAGVTTVLGRAVVDVRLRTGGQPGGGREVELADRTVVAADVVVAALGARPAVEWLASAGLHADDGVRTDVELRAVLGGQAHASLQLTAPGIAVAGDLARWPHPVFGDALVRVGHWSNALAQGAHAARTVLRDLGVAETSDGPVAFDHVPAYSTYVHGTKVHVVGLPHLGHRTQTVRAKGPDGRFAVAHLDADGTVVGAVAVAGARPATALRPLIAARRPLADLGAA